MGADAEAFDRLAERTGRLLRVVGELAGDTSLARPSANSLTVGGLQEALDAAEVALATRARSHPVDADRIGVTLSELARLHLDLRAHAMQRERAAFGALHQALRHLRKESTSEELFSRAPHEAACLGFNRVLYSSVEHQRWIPVAYHTEHGPQEARAVMDASGPPYRRIGDLLESELVRRRQAMLVHDALDHPRVHPDLQAVIRSSSYVAAPVLGPAGGVVGFLSADQNSDSGTVDDLDRDVVAMFAEGLGLALARIALHEEMADVRTRLGRHADALRDLMTELDGPDQAMPSGPPPRPLVASGASDLTRREQEVLELITDGLTNAAIAATLYISEGTAKTHVKSILHKLGAQNRAEAAAIHRRNSSR